MPARGMSNPSMAPLLERLKTHAGAPRDFWPLFLEVAAGVTGAQAASLWAKKTAPSAEGELAAWSPVMTWPAGDAAQDNAGVVPEAEKERFAMIGGEAAFSVGGGETGAGIVLLRGLPSEREEIWRDLAALLALLPDHYQSARELRRLREELDGVVWALDLSLLLAREKKFTGAALAVCNELAARFGCDRVSLGWQDNGVMKLAAMSQSDKFNHRMQIIRCLEVAMEETVDQDEELAWPDHTGGQSVVREHAAYARESGVTHVASTPLRGHGQPLGACLLERATPMNAVDWKRLRLSVDQAGPRLAELHERSRWFVPRLWRRLKTWSAGFLGPKNTGPKLAGVIGALVVLFLVAGRLPYSVEAPAVLRSTQVVFVTAPFEGFVDDVNVAVGDAVAAGAPLATFDTRDLLLRQSAELANLNRFQKEAERARAQGNRAEMAIAQAQADQARAVLDRTRFQLQQASIIAPFAGMVVEGDLRKRIGSPLRQGEVLVQIARLDDLYVEVEVSERDVHDILGRKNARLMFAAQPEHEYRLVIDRVHPSAQPRPSGPVFVVQAAGVERAPDWWRPGMSGTVRIDAGWRNVFWILTHRTTDWLRQRLWW